MSTGIWRFVVGFVAAAAILLGATWFDHGVMIDAQRTAAASFDGRGESIAFSLGYIALATVE